MSDRRHFSNNDNELKTKFDALKTQSAMQQVLHYEQFRDTMDQYFTDIINAKSCKRCRRWLRTHRGQPISHHPNVVRPNNDLSLAVCQYEVFQQWLDYMVRNKTYIDMDDIFKEELRTVLIELHHDRRTRIPPFDWHFHILTGGEHLPPPPPSPLNKTPPSTAPTPCQSLVSSPAAIDWTANTESLPAWAVADEPSPPNTNVKKDLDLSVSDHSESLEEDGAEASRIAREEFLQVFRDFYTSEYGDLDTELYGNLAYSSPLDCTGLCFDDLAFCNLCEYIKHEYALDPTFDFDFHAQLPATVEDVYQLAMMAAAAAE